MNAVVLCLYGQGVWQLSHEKEGENIREMLPVVKAFCQDSWF